LSIPGIGLYTFQGWETVTFNGNNGALGDTEHFTSPAPTRRTALNSSGCGRTAADPVLKLHTLDGVNTLMTLINYTNVQTLRVNSLDAATSSTSTPAPPTATVRRWAESPPQEKSTDRLNVFYTPSRPRIIQSVPRRTTIRTGRSALHNGSGSSFSI